jgi:D-alanyl-D-alanine carboxypeptidase
LLTAVSRSMLLLLAVLALALGPHPSVAQAKPKPKQAAMVVDANTGTVLYDQDGDEPRFPASLTKMMTLYMLFGEIEAGRATYETPIRISARANGMAPSKLGLAVGDEIAAIDAIKVLVVKSANDIAVAVAEHIGGTEYQFARMMTERARQIGMRRTTFRNASGLPDAGQLTTARDMLTLALRLKDDYPQHYRLFSTTSVSYRGKVYKTHNTLLTGFPGMDGIKTGYTRASGFNLVSSVQTNGKWLVGAVFGGKTAKTRNAHMRSILFAALEKASTERTRPSEQRLIAVQRRAAPAAAEVAWTADTQAPKPAAPPAVAPRVVLSQIPPPVPAVRRARQSIAGVLEEEGDDSSADAAPARPADAASPPPRLDLQALRAAMSDTQDVAAASAPAGAAPARATAAPGPTDIAGLIRESIVDGVAADASARAPSTLESQARTLAASAPPSRLQGPAGGTQVAVASIGSGFEIQIGAYSSSSEAQAKLDAVRTRAASLLEGHGGVTMPMQRADRQIFRARFVSFDESTAAHTCLELRRLAIDCLVMKAD